MCTNPFAHLPVHPIATLFRDTPIHFFTPKKAPKKYFYTTFENMGYKCDVYRFLCLYYNKA